MKFTVETVKRKNRLGLKSADFYLVAVLLIITVKQLALKNDTEFDVSGYQGGTNRIVIQDNAVYMSDADCPDKLCVHTGTIHKTGETIVCLPHRVVVEITGTTDTFDAVVQ